MKHLLAGCLLIISFSCSSRKQNDEKIPEEQQSLLEELQDETLFTIDEDNEDFLMPTNNYTRDENNYIISTYDLQDFELHRKTLRQLSENKVFSFFQERIFPNLAEKHKNYFNSNLNFELIFYAKGDLFQNRKEDYAFVVFDKENSRITILVYDESANKYSELYRDIKVEGELECNYYHYGTLDFKLGQELIYNEKSIMGDIAKSPKNYMLYYRLCKITNIQNDDDFVLERGCFAKDVSKKYPLNSLCVATSFIYNNWECLLYDKSKNTFKIIYGQEFAD
jgi:hypothetical protein